MGFFGDLCTLAKEIRDKQGMDKTIQIFRAHKGDELYWQYLLDIIAQVQYWTLKREQCAMAGQERGFEMAAKNEQKFLECLDRIEREVGIDKDELGRRISKALGRDRAKEEQVPFKKTMHIEEAAEALVLLCASESLDEDSPEPWALQPLHKEVETVQFVERTNFITEATFLAYSAVDYATASVLGQHNPTRSAILDSVYIKFMSTVAKDNTDFGLALTDVLNERLTMYALAFHAPHAQAMESLCLIGATFSKLNEGRTTDPDIVVKAGVHFAAIVDHVKKFLNSVNLVY